MTVFNFSAKKKKDFEAEDLEALIDITSLIQPYGVIIYLLKEIVGYMTSYLRY